MKINLKFDIAALDFSKIEERVISVNMTDINETTSIVEYWMSIPKYLFDAVKDTMPQFMVTPIQRKGNQKNYEPFKQQIKSVNITDLRNIILSVSNAAISNEVFTKYTATKVICIKFSSKTTEERTDWNFADAGLRTGINFQYFVAYKKGENADYYLRSDAQKKSDARFKNIYGVDTSDLFKPEEDKYRYYSRKTNYTNQSSCVKNDTCGMEVNNFFLHHFPTDVAGFEAQYTIIKWTQEREDYFEMLQKRFILMSEQLNEFLKDLDEDKVNLLIENVKMLALLPKNE
jgi:hypothetical protein